MTERNRRTDEYAALIAGHYDSSGDAVAAGRWYYRAAQQASSVHALDEATRLLDRAVELVPDDEPPLRFDVILAREGVFDRTGDRDAQRRDLDALDALAPQVDDRRRIQLPAALGELALPPQRVRGAGETRRRTPSIWPGRPAWPTWRPTPCCGGAGG